MDLLLSLKMTQIVLERTTLEGDSPVEEVREDFEGIQSTAYRILGGNSGGIYLQP